MPSASGIASGNPAFLYLIPAPFETCGMDFSGVDFIAVSRAAYQLELDHGANAYLYAGKLANEARLEANTEKEKFWNAVAAELTPRGR